MWVDCIYIHVVFDQKFEFYRHMHHKISLVGIFRRTVGTNPLRR